MGFNSLADVFRNAAKRIAAPTFTKIMISIANDIANDAKENASWSSKIPDAISVGAAEYGNDTISVKISVDGIMAPMAVAYEYGSGVHGKKNATYPITGNPGLYFLWHPGGAKERQYSEWVKFHQVDHPGVEANPFLQPAADDNMEAFKAKVAGTVAEILADELSVTVSYGT